MPNKPIVMLWFFSKSKNCHIQQFLNYSMSCPFYLIRSTDAFFLDNVSSRRNHSCSLGGCVSFSVVFTPSSLSLRVGEHAACACFCFICGSKQSTFSRYWQNQIFYRRVQKIRAKRHDRFMIIHIQGESKRLALRRVWASSGLQLLLRALVLGPH